MSANEITWKKITQEEWQYFLEVLPPADYNRHFNAFLVGEPFDHDANGRPRYEAFETRAGECYQSSRPMTRAEFRKVCGP